MILKGCLKDLWSLLRMQHTQAGLNDHQWDVAPEVDRIRCHLFGAVWVLLGSLGDVQVTSMRDTALQQLLTAEELQGIDTNDGAHSYALLQKVYVLWANAWREGSLVGNQESVNATLNELRSHFTRITNNDLDDAGIPFIYTHLMNAIVFLFLFELPFSMFCSWYSIPFYVVLAIFDLGILELSVSLKSPCRPRTFSCVHSPAILTLTALIAQCEAHFLVASGSYRARVKAEEEAAAEAASVKAEEEAVAAAAAAAARGSAETPKVSIINSANSANRSSGRSELGD